MNLITRLIDHGPLLFGGSTLLLGVGCLLVTMHRSPLHRQRLAELCVAGASLWLILALIPLPRWIAWSDGGSVTSALSLKGDELTVRPTVVALPDASWGGAGEVGSTRPDLSTKPSAMLPVASSSSPPRTFDGAPAGPESDPLAFQFLPPVLPTSVATFVTTSGPDPAPLHGVASGRSASVSGSEPQTTRGQRIAILFVAGSCLSLLWAAFGAWRLQRLLLSTRAAPQTLRDLLPAHHLKTPLRLRITDRDCRPFCFGLFRTVIVIPARLTLQRHQQALHHVLRHEAAHAQQRDARGVWLFTLARTLFWIHPLYWWLHHQHRLATELVADDIAARSSSRPHYARELIRLVEPAFARTPAAAPLAVSYPNTHFYTRIKMLLSRKEPLPTRCTRLRRTFHHAGLLTVLALATASWGAQPLAAQEPERGSIEEAWAALARYEVMVTDLRDENQKLMSMIADLQATLNFLEASQRSSDAGSSPAATDLLAGENSLPSGSYVIVVQKGDTLARLLAEYTDGSPKMIEEVIRLNRESLMDPGVDPRLSGRLAVGQRLVFPESSQRLALEWLHANVGEFATREGLQLNRVFEADLWGEAIESGGGAGGAVGQQPLGLPGAKQPTNPGANQPLLPEGEVVMTPHFPGASSLGGPTTLGMANSSLDSNAALDLAFRAIDMRAELRLAEHELPGLAALSEKGMVPSGELERQEMQVRTLNRKMAMVEAMLTARIAECAHQIERLASPMTRAHPDYPHGQIEILRAQMEILGSALSD